MQRLRFLGLTCWSVAACVCGSAVQARPADRPVSCPRDGYCCPYGLGQWEGRPHRYVYGEYGYGEGGDASPAMTAPLPLVLDETQGPVGAQRAPGQFYDDIGNSNFDCPYDREAHPAAATERASDNHPACRGEETCDSQSCDEGLAGECGAGEGGGNEAAPLGGLEATMSHWRHSAGLWIVDHLNAESDGLDETVAGELDWSAIAAEIESREAEVDIQGPPPDSGACRGDSHEESQEPGRVRQWCGEVWGAVRSAATRFSQGVGRLAERISPEPATTADEAAGETEVETPVETIEPHIEAVRPRLPDYFLPAFGSPWDGEALNALRQKTRGITTALTAYGRQGFSCFGRREPAWDRRAVRPACACREIRKKWLAGMAGGKYNGP